MGVVTERFQVETRGETDIVDITNRVERIISDSPVVSGTATVFVSGSTAGISTVEYENGLVHDLIKMYEQIAPREGEYRHNLRWGDGNGFAHIRASITGQSFTIPFCDRRPLLGTWQQIILIDFDNRPRKREIIVQIVGE
jgi:secondary thiamine-phosphate synthase enzyme